MHKTGDVLLGGLFSVRFLSTFPELSFSSEPQLPHCDGFDVSGFRQAQTMAFAIDEINRKADLLPNVNLGYHMYDTCQQTTIGFRAVMSLISGREKQVILEETCVGTPPVLGIVGDPSPTPSFAISSVLGLYRVPLVSHFSTCSCLSEQQKFSSFFRTIPSLSFQVRAMIHILKHFGWSWVGLLVTNDDYGVQVARAFGSDLGPVAGSCLAYAEVLPWDEDRAELRRIVDVMRKSTARVVIAFAPVKQMTELIDEVVRQNVTGLQWMASEAWALASALQTPRLMPFLGGTLGIASRPGELPGFRDFLLNIRPDLQHNSSLGNNMVNVFWEHTFQCRFAPPPAGWLEAGGMLCSGQETLGEALEEQFLNVSDLRSEYNVYKAVYSLAYALDELLQCETGGGALSSQVCAHLQRLEPQQMVYYLKKVNFTTTFGDQVSYDENGDALPIYDIMNWVQLPDGSTEVQNVGEVRGSAVKNELILHEDTIFWNFESKQPPRSICGHGCPPGTYMVQRMKGPKCCFNCAPCPKRTFSNNRDSMECTTCPLGFKPNTQRDNCVPSRTFLSFHEPVSIFFSFSAVVGTLTCSAVFGIFIYYRNTPIVRSNNSELSFVLLVFLKMGFLCSFLFIGQPDKWTCRVRHVGGAICFVLFTSCVLVKTIVVLAVFKSSKPGSESSMKWFGAAQQRGTIVFLTLIEVMVCTMWLVSLSSPYKNEWSRRDRVVYECSIRSLVGQSINMYISVLTLICFVIAFMARNIPSNFNEAKLISFSMVVHFSCGIGAAITTINRQGKDADMMKILSILSTCFGILFILFGPKCYIILFRPDKNTKKAIMAR